MQFTSHCEHLNVNMVLCIFFTLNDPLQVISWKMCVGFFFFFLFSLLWCFCLHWHAMWPSGGITGMADIVGLFLFLFFHIVNSCWVQALLGPSGMASVASPHPPKQTRPFPVV